MIPDRVVFYDPVADDISRYLQVILRESFGDVRPRPSFGLSKKYLEVSDQTTGSRGFVHGEGENGEEYFVDEDVDHHDRPSHQRDS